MTTNPAAAVSAQVRVVVAQAMSQLHDEIAAQAQSIAPGATPAQVLQGVQVAVSNVQINLRLDQF